MLSFIRYKNDSNFEKICPVCVHLRVKFSIEFQFNEYLGEKTQIFLPAEPFSFMSHVKCLLKGHLNLFRHKKILVAHL